MNIIGIVFLGTVGSEALSYRFLPDIQFLSPRSIVSDLKLQRRFRQLPERACVGAGIWPCCQEFVLLALPVRNPLLPNRYNQETLLIHYSTSELF